MPADREDVELDAPRERGHQRLEVEAVADDRELGGRLRQPDRGRAVGAGEHGEAGRSVRPELPVVDQTCGSREELTVGDLLRGTRDEPAEQHRVLRDLPTGAVGRQIERDELGRAGGRRPRCDVGSDEIDLVDDAKLGVSYRS